ncbi:uncharacterized protein I206_104767 [Kwoniella pini CBS 10737]|uniref:Uncharacterized protein n=1 Tax=Kwoniella pini CBS 10737 TaxID=1296096 RepID=A0A1B9I7S1_9TREE|nr:uncharacterized protein I206_02305 [Kwoniella pini CBS 10737]OCF51590.1 hypothetical protein I206_02305 [Kwoniella pini CBS 10737]
MPNPLNYFSADSRRDRQIQRLERLQQRVASVEAEQQRRYQTMTGNDASYSPYHSESYSQYGQAGYIQQAYDAHRVDPFIPTLATPHTTPGYTFNASQSTAADEIYKTCSRCLDPRPWNASSVVRCIVDGWTRTVRRNRISNLTILDGPTTYRWKCRICGRLANILGYGNRSWVKKCRTCNVPTPLVWNERHPETPYQPFTYCCQNCRYQVEGPDPINTECGPVRIFNTTCPCCEESQPIVPVEFRRDRIYACRVCHFEADMSRMGKVCQWCTRASGSKRRAEAAGSYIQAISDI